MGSMDAKRFQQETYLLCCAQVDLKSFVDEVIAKVQERKVGMPQGGGEAIVETKNGSILSIM